MSYNEKLQELYRKYEKDGHMQPFTMHELAAWAYDNGLCQPQRSTMVTRLAEDFSRAMRADFHTDAQGRRVRRSTWPRTSEMESSTLFGLTSASLPVTTWNVRFSNVVKASLGIAGS